MSDEYEVEILSLVLLILLFILSSLYYLFKSITG